MKKILVDVSKQMVEYCQSSEAREKPYNICLQCPYMPDSCDGPNVLAMEYPRWVEWVKGRMSQMGLSKNALSERSGVALSTIKGFLSESGYDIRTDTMRRITKVLVGGSWGTYPCHFAALLMEGTDLDEDTDSKKAAELEAEVEELTNKIREIKEEYKEEIKFLREQIEIRDKYLAEKNQTINKLMDRLLNEKKD